MESLTRLVSESLARHGFDRPLDYRRLHWSRWFRCESHHSLLSVPSKPGVFAIAEEIMDWDRCLLSTTTHCPSGASKLPAPQNRRMLAVTKFFEDDDMAFTLDRMLSWQNPMRARLESGRFFIRYVSNRRSSPAAQHLYRPESMDCVVHRTRHRHRLPFCDIAGSDSNRDDRGKRECRQVHPHPLPRSSRPPARSEIRRPFRLASNARGPIALRVASA